MKDLTYSERMMFTNVLIRNEEKREAFEATVKMAKKILRKNKVKIIRSNAKENRV